MVAVGFGSGRATVGTEGGGRVVADGSAEGMAELLAGSGAGTEAVGSAERAGAGMVRADGKAVSTVALALGAVVAGAFCWLA